MIPLQLAQEPQAFDREGATGSDLSNCQISGEGKLVANRQGWGVASRHETGERVLIFDECRLD